MNITWLGNATILLETAGERLLFDPFAELIGGEHPVTVADFEQYDTIFATHGHFDHLYFVPDLLDGQDKTLFCTQTPAETVEQYADAGDEIVQVRPGDSFHLGAVQVTVYKGQHIRYNPAYVFRLLFSRRFFRHLRNAWFIQYAQRRFPENGETVCYEIASEGKTVFLLGSLGLDAAVEYPTGADVLILPFQGSDQLEEKALAVVERLKPKRIVLSHFDDAFPPISRHVSTGKLHRLLREQYPQIRAVRPSFGKTMTI